MTYSPPKTSPTSNRLAEFDARYNDTAQLFTGTSPPPTRLTCLANNFARFEFYPVLEHVVPDRRVLDLMVRLLEPCPVLFVTLAPSLDVAVRRNIGRPTLEQVGYSFAKLREEH